MKVYRISRTKYARDLSGEGARLFGGRWNQKLIPCLYTAESRSLAVLEYTVNINIDDIPRALSMITLEIPDKDILRPTMLALPGDWDAVPAPESTKDFGTSLLRQQHRLVIRVPSSVVPEEYNYLINPLHPDITGVKILNVADFVYDVRIKLV